MTARRRGLSTPGPGGPPADAPRVLFVTLSNDVGSDRIVSDIGRHGGACAVLGPPRCYASLSRVVDAHFSLPARLGVWASMLALRARLAAAVRTWRPDDIVPLDELSALALRTIARDSGTDADIRAVLIRSFGSVAGYEAACHRVPLMETAARSGVRLPAFASAGTPTADAVPFPLLVKRDHSSGSGGVVLARDSHELTAALRQARLKTSAKQMLARAAGFHHGPAPILLQQHIEGQLAMRTAVCRDGRVLDGISLMAVTIHPTKRASTMLRPIDNPDMTKTVRRIVATLGCSGFVSFDFIVDETGRAFLIEMNARPIGSTHLGRLFGHDLCQAFLKGDAAAPVPASPTAVAESPVIALFPKELERDPTSSCLARTSNIYHDVPRDEPDIIEAYLAHLAALYPTQIADLRARLGTPAPGGSAVGAWQPAAGSEICM